MELIPLPDKFEIKKVDTSQADIIIEPCYPGYGTTLGNALRRVLLSSLSGAAITAIKIKNATHEFSALPGVKEDIVEIILNLKKLRFKLHGAAETQATLKVKGAQKVTAKEIKGTSELEVVSQSALIATLTEKTAELEIEFFISAGRGYLPVENIEKKKFPLGTIAIDAIFTPVKNVNFSIEHVRVGQMTNFDRLILGISTDGTITPAEALNQAATILVEHFNRIAHPEQSTTTAVETETTESAEESKPVTEVNKENEPEEKTEDTTKTKKKRGRPKKE